MKNAAHTQTHRHAYIAPLRQLLCTRSKCTGLWQVDELQNSESRLLTFFCSAQLAVTPRCCSPPIPRPRVPLQRDALHPPASAHVQAAPIFNTNTPTKRRTCYLDMYAHARVLLQRLCCQLVAVALWYIERLQRLVIHLCCCRGGRYNLHRCVRAHVARRARIFSVKCNFVHQRNFDCVAHARQQRQKLLWLTMFFVVAK